MFYRLREELEKPGSFAGRDYCLADLDDPAGQHNLRDDAFPDFQPGFSSVILTGDSSLVDFIHDGNAIGGQGLLVSEKVLGILEAMKLPPYQPYPLEVVHKGTSIANRYFWLQILTLANYGWIDFGKSQFTLKHHLDMEETEGEPVSIGSERELKAIIEGRKADFWILFTKLTLNSVYARAPFDLFYFDRLGGLSSAYPIINERLKAAFERENVVGYQLAERREIVIDAG